MDAESIRKLLLALPHVEETMQWGANLVFWVGDKAVGGKMFALVNLDSDGKAEISFAAGPERYAELIELEGVIPAPYMARIYWVAVERWNVFRPQEWRELLQTAHDLTYAKMPQRIKTVLAMSPAEYKKLVTERRKLLAARARQAGPASRSVPGGKHDKAQTPVRAAKRPAKAER